MGVTNTLATDPKAFQIYASIDNSDQIKFLKYRIVEAPAHGIIVSFIFLSFIYLFICLMNRHIVS